MKIIAASQSGVYAVKPSHPVVSDAKALPSSACRCGRHSEFVEKKCILIVDDSAARKQLIAFVLRNVGYEVMFTDSFTKTLDILKSFRIDMVLIDMDIAGKDTLSFVAEFRMNPGHESTPVVLMAARTGKTEKRQGSDAGVNGWVRKPFTPDVLIKAIRKFLK